MAGASGWGGTRNCWSVVLYTGSFASNRISTSESRDPTLHRCGEQPLRGEAEKCVGGPGNHFLSDAVGWRAGKAPQNRNYVIASGIQFRKNEQHLHAAFRQGADPPGNLTCLPHSIAAPKSGTCVRDQHRELGAVARG